MGLKYLPRNGEKELNDQDQQQLLSKKEMKSRFENKAQSATDQTEKVGIGGSDTEKFEGHDNNGEDEEEQIEKTNRTTPLIAQSNSQIEERGLGQE